MISFDHFTLETYSIDLLMSFPPTWFVNPGILPAEYSRSALNIFITKRDLPETSSISYSYFSKFLEVY